MVHYRPEGATGKQCRRFFARREDAEIFQADLRKQVRSVGVSALALTPAEIREYREAKEMADGADLVTVAKEWRKRIKVSDCPTLSAAFLRFMADQEGNGDPYQRALRANVGALLDQLGTGRRVDEPTPGEIEGALLAFPHAAETLANKRRMLTTFIAFCRRQGWRSDDPMQRVRKFKVARPTAQFYSVPQCRALLEAVAVGAPWLLPAVALRLFAGVRSYETKRLAADWTDDVQPAHRRILIRAEVAKGRAGSPRPRLIEGLPDPVWRWLDLGPLWWPSWGDEMLRSALGESVPEIKNGLRHTFATYAVAYFESTEKTARIMGNSAEIVRKHYAGLATRAQAEEFFALAPEGW